MLYNSVLAHLQFALCLLSAPHPASMLEKSKPSHVYLERLLKNVIFLFSSTSFTIKLCLGPKNPRRRANDSLSTSFPVFFFSDVSGDGLDGFGSPSRGVSIHQGRPLSRSICRTRRQFPLGLSSCPRKTSLVIVTSQAKCLEGGGVR